MNEKEYKQYIRIQKQLEKIKNKSVPNTSIQRDIERRKKVLDSWLGMGI